MERRRRVKKSLATPIRKALEEQSPLQQAVRDGLGACKDAHRAYIDENLRAAFADSLDCDEAMRAIYPDDHRWDYLFGYRPSGVVIGLEPHSAKEDQISTVIEKRKAALEQLRPHLKEGARVETWLWVASGTVHFADTEKARRRLDQSGIKFVGKRVLEKHLLAATRP
jgi:hypothetical protein